MAKTVNPRLLEDVKRETGESVSLIRSIISFQNRYIIDIMKEGAFETVMLPYLGKFKPNIKAIQRRAHNRGSTKPISNGTIQDNGEL